MIFSDGNVIYPSVLRRGTKYLERNRQPFSVSSSIGIPKWATQFSQKLQAKAVTISFCVGMAFLNLVYLSVMTTTKWLLGLVRKSGPGVSMQKYLRGPYGEIAQLPLSISMRSIPCT